MKYVYYLVDFNVVEGTSYYTYNVYKKWWFFHWPIFTVESEDREYCIKECQEFIKNNRNTK